MKKISVLISVYSKVSADNLQQSLDSIFSQTMPPNEVVLVEDGPLTDALNTVIEQYTRQHEELHVVKLPENGHQTKEPWFQQNLQKGQFHHCDTAPAIMSSGSECPGNKEGETAWKLSEYQSSCLPS